MSEFQAFLRKVPLFADLPEDDLVHLCASVKEIHLAPGEELFREGDQDRLAYVIIAGKIEIFKRSAGRDVRLAVRGSGEVIGELALLEAAPRIAGGRALVDSHLLQIDQRSFDVLIESHPGVVRSMLRTVVERLRATEAALRQSERLAQLGMFTAGLAHELNNPAAAVSRGAGQLREVLGQLCDAQLLWKTASLTQEQVERLRAAALNGQGGRGASSGALDDADRAERLESWLADRAVAGAWDFVPVLVERGFSPEYLEQLFHGFSPAALAAGVTWLGAVSTVQSLAGEIGEGSTRMSEIVRALKAYVYLDQAPVQSVDVREGLENTLVILRHKLKGIRVERKFAPDLPRVQANGGELNQVWTNLIDNAADSLGGAGKIGLQALLEDAWVVVRIVDDGPGIAPRDLERLFSPFFTTKPLGQGTGLGLHTSLGIVQRNGGELRVRSHPGETVFEVRLPVDAAGVTQALPGEPIERQTAETNGEDGIPL